jgi:hypothetical protein
VCREALRDLVVGDAVAGERSGVLRVITARPCAFLLAGTIFSVVSTL